MKKKAWSYFKNTCFKSQKMPRSLILLIDNCLWEGEYKELIIYDNVTFTSTSTEFCGHHELSRVTHNPGNAGYLLQPNPMQNGN